MEILRSNKKKFPYLPFCSRILLLWVLQVNDFEPKSLKWQISKCKRFPLSAQNFHIKLLKLLGFTSKSFFVPKLGINAKLPLNVNNLHQKCISRLTDM